VSIYKIFSNQFSQIRNGGINVFFRKIKVLFENLPFLPLYIFISPFVIIVRLLSPWYLIRFGALISSRIGHFAGNTELYLCEKDEGINLPNRPYCDIFFFSQKPICNIHLANMWKRYLLIWPAWLISPIYNLIGVLPGGREHYIGQNTQNDRDVHNLLDKYPAHLRFTNDEENRGKVNLQAMGVPLGAPFVCFIVRDKAYLDKHMPCNNWSYHDYRDCSIENFVLAAEELSARGYYVIRMGALVGKAFPTKNPRIIDYAFNGMRSEFMDIYLGAKCSFCVSSGTGWDAVPLWLFRKPGVYTNFAPIGNLPTFSRKFIFISKKHFDINSNIELSLSQIFSRGVGFCGYSAEFEDLNVKLVENTSEEICDVVLEMENRISNNYSPDYLYEEFQSKFFNLFPCNAVDSGSIPLHGKILGSYGYEYLKKNQDWLK
jgi:putative glycosyltransferase (TIGR04372 family)